MSAGRGGSPEPPGSGGGGFAAAGAGAARILELKGISKAFGGLQVIDGLDLHVDEGEIVSVIGPNGAGKTTLFNLITGVYEPDHGQILLGALLVALMNARPQGLLGSARVEIV